ncbi:HD-GYP domain, c-di-GMP phosphodiesterase class II (or its inactivated variant) [Geosporobacter subterraneus DSM 17957]|uniref:HD-GYP domain, c-di-GMP phosphodiesterase class II (Or its inactivated variant) n=1 Tax=Geosporobacter subterraneus DSM 17957 TaxID=1121919 RepID=A0A1M6EIY6_9FIRM|nr:HD domain-containing phosphohydrolase [Geosporobacter subterraneus]SHI85389.1 HD-GYP domain, c-di-GMP phosphodiesterase class II (or its inactivated variant) [Geosporobacter subterraneus DSM 17957]
MNSIKNNELYRQGERLTTQEELLAAKFSIIADAFVNTNNLNKNDFFSRVFETAFILIPEAQKGSFYELEGETYKPIFCKGYDFELLSQLTFSKDEAFIDFESTPTQMIDAYQVSIKRRDDTLFSEKQIDIFKKLGTYSDFASLYAPIKLDELKIGLICIENFDEKVFSETSRLVLKIFAQLISNFYSLKVHQERENKRNKEIISALVSAIEVKDVYTEGHAKRVSDISLKLARAMDVPANRHKTIETAAILHDIGKIGTPTEILNKKSSLTKDEYEIVKRHPLDAKKILEKIEGFKEIVDLTYMHHEHYDGSGYPAGLSGDKIPIEAQIIQAADAYDAMTSKRAYRDAMSIKTVMSIFKAERGKQFHPAVTDAMLRLFNE